MRFFSHFCMNSYYPETKETRYIHGKQGTISHFFDEELNKHNHQKKHRGDSSKKTNISM